MEVIVDTTKGVYKERIVRCRECKYWDEEDHWCNIRDSYGWDYKPTDFCSYGEVRDE